MREYNTDLIFYNYVYLDPRKPGDYNYGDLYFDYEPFLIGKGKDDRCYNHLYETIDTTYNPHKVRKINKIREVGLEPIILKIYNNLDEKTALENEIVLIKLIGKINNETGPLTNITDGGERGGIWNFLTNDEQLIIKNKISEKISGINNPNYGGKSVTEYQKKLASNRGKKRWSGSGNHWYGKNRSGEKSTFLNRKHTIDSIQKMKECKLGKKASKETKELMSRQRKGIKKSKESIIKHYKPVIKNDIYDNFIEEYQSIKNAAYENNIRESGISACCKGRLKTSGGFIWKYKENNI